MNRLTLQSLLTGLLFFVAGLISYQFFSIRDDGLITYFFLVFGAWEFGDGLSDFIDGTWRKVRLPKFSLSDLHETFKSNVIQLTIPILMCIGVEVIMLDTQLGYMAFAYIGVWAIYVFVVALFVYGDHLLQEVGIELD